VRLWSPSEQDWRTQFSGSPNLKYDGKKNAKMNIFGRHFWAFFGYFLFGAGLNYQLKSHCPKFVSNLRLPLLPTSNPTSNAKAEANQKLRKRDQKL
jgi:hypothetical protein